MGNEFKQKKKKGFHVLMTTMLRVCMPGISLGKLGAKRNIGLAFGVKREGLRGLIDKGAKSNM